MRGLVVGALLATAACNGKSGPAAPPPVTAPSPDAVAPAPAPALDAPKGDSMAAPTIVAKVTGQKAGRPPLMFLTVDVTIDNPGPARWISLASKVPPDDGTGGGVDRLEVHGDDGAAVIGTFSGTGGFHAVHVAAASKVTIQNLPVRWWRGTPPGPMPKLDVIVADDLTVDGKPASAWFGVEPLITDGATVNAGGYAVREHKSDGPEVPVVLTGAAPSAVDLAQ